MVQIITVGKSKGKDKKLVAILDTGKQINFGLEGSINYTAGA